MVAQSYPVPRFLSGAKGLGLLGGGVRGRGVAVGWKGAWRGRRRGEGVLCLVRTCTCSKFWKMLNPLQWNLIKRAQI